MKAINLIPKLPFAQQHLKTLMTGIVVFSLGSSGLVVFGYSHSSQAVEKNNSQLQERQAQAERLMKERATDKQTVQYQSLQGKVETLKEELRDWQPVFEGITASLPTAARIISMEADAEGKIKVHLDMKDLKDAAQYMQLLQKLDLFDEVSANSVQKKELAYPAPITIVSSDTTLASPSSSSGGTRSMTFEEYVNLFQKSSGSPSAKSESDELLNQLDWMMSQKISKEMNGITLPGRSPETVPAPSDTGTITKQDVEEAQKKLDQIQNVTIIDPSATGSASAASAAPTPAPRIQILYDVVLELTCKPVVKEKKS